MTPIAIHEAIERGYVISLEIERLNAKLKEIKKTLAQEAASRPTEHVPAGESDGTVWNFETLHTAVAVTFPTDTLKESINLDSKLFEKIEMTVPEAKLFGKLFERVHAIKPVSGFRALVEELLPKATAAKLLKLCTSASSPTVKFKPVSR